MKMNTNRMVKKRLLFILLCLGTFPISHFAETGEGGQAGAFLRFGAGARAFSMGRTFTAVANDASAAYWNPAGLGDLHYKEFMGTYGLLSLERKHNYMALSIPSIKFGTFSVSWINLGVSGIEGRDINENVTNMFSNSENAYAVSWGRKLSPAFSVGVTAKLLIHTLDTHRATGHGFDVGLLYKANKQIRLGLTVQDMGGSLGWDTDFKDKIPMSTRLGAAYTFVNFPALIAFDYEMVQNESGRLHLGVEATLVSNGGLRFGLDNGRFAGGGFLTIPIGDKYLRADYSVGEDAMDKTYVHRLSLSFRFSSPIGYIQAEDQSSEYDEINSLFNSAQAVPEARVIKVTAEFPNYALINAGSQNGISVGLIYNIFRDTQSELGAVGQTIMIGTARVVKVEEDMAAIRVRWLKEGYYLQMGDILMHSDAKEDEVDIKSDILSTYPYP